MTSAKPASFSGDDMEGVPVPPLALPAGWRWLGVLALAALPVAKWWKITDDGDSIVALVAFAVVFLVWLEREWRRMPAVTTVGSALAAIACLGFLGWMLYWLRAEDFWFLRWSLPVGGGALLLMLWGWSGLLRGARGLLALLFWALVPPGLLPYHGAPEFLPTITASCAGFLLSLLGAQPVVTGKFIQLPQGVVDVLPGCTAMPLLLTLGNLAVPAALLLRVRWQRVLVVAVATAVVAFVISIVRVAVMAWVVNDHVRFEYWHGAEGASWFTAVAMVAMAWFFSLALRKKASSELPPALPLSRGQAWTLGLMCGASLLAALAVVVSPPAAFPAPDAPAPVLAGYTLEAADTQQTLDWKPMDTRDERSPFAWTRRAIYHAAGTTIEVKFGGAPNLLNGDPMFGAKHFRGRTWDIVEEEWLEQPLGPGGAGAIREHATPGRLDWVGTLPPGTLPIATNTAWLAHRDMRLRSPRTWLRWLAGRAPLRDKHACWLAVGWTGAGIPPRDVMQIAFESWAKLAFSPRNSPQL